MPRTVAIGNQRFEELIRRNCFYVDKTGFIEEWWNSVDQVTLITRPRRFGKTLNMDMMERFFSVKYKDNPFNPFENLLVWKNEDLRRNYCGYPVVFLSFAGVKSNTFEGLCRNLTEIIFEQFRQYEYLTSSERISPIQKKYFDRYVEFFLYGNEEMNISFSLKFLSELLYTYYGREVIILLDEYDTPMQEAWNNHCWDKMVNFIRELFNNTFKTNKYLYRALMTGITRVSKESIFSDFNNPKIATILSDQYADAFGFTQTEVDQALVEYNIESPDQVRLWYDGFTIGDHTDIYNPWSISNFLSERKFNTYWANTSSNGLVSTLMCQGNTDIKAQLEALLRGESIEATVTDELVFDQLYKDSDSVWSLLLCSGYIKAIGENPEKNTKLLTITNYETRRMFERMVVSWFAKNRTERNSFIDYLIRGDVGLMNMYLSQITRNTFSYFDVGNGDNWEKYENFYHGFAIGLIVDLKDDYNITSNRESGLGCYDLCLCKKDLSRGIVLEFKAVRDEEGETLESAADSALDQIKTKDYARTLLSAGVAEENISLYGLAFRGKEVLIKEA